MPVTKVCIQCNKTYKTKPVYLATTRFCSISCSSASRVKAVPRECINCGKTFSTKLSQLNTYKNAGKYCSRTCGYNYRSNKTLENIKYDRHGRGQSRPDRDWKLAVREQDNFTCQRCGVYDAHIDTHHIASRARRPDLRYKVSNGICLDRPCHQWVHHHPLEATKLGLMSGAKYELDRLATRIVKIATKNTTIPVRPCQTCTIQFKPKTSKGKYCSQPCYWESKRTVKPSVF